MPESAGTIKAAILIRIQGSDSPIEIGTVEMPLRAEPAGDGKVQCSVDASVFERFGKALAEAIEEPETEPVEVLKARQRLALAERALAFARRCASPEGASQLVVEEAQLNVERARAELKTALEG